MLKNLIRFTFALAIAGAFVFLPQKADAWGSMYDVLPRATSYPPPACSGTFPCPFTNFNFFGISDTVSVHLSHTSSTFQFYWTDEIVNLCQSLGGSMPVVDSVDVGGNGNYIYPDANFGWNGGNISHALTPGFQTISGSWSPSEPTTLENGIFFRFSCRDSELGYKVWTGSASYLDEWRYTFSDQTSTYVDFADEILYQLENYASPTSTLAYDTATARAWCVATSTGGWVNDIGAGLKQAMCDTAVTLFVPSQTSLNTLVGKKDQILLRFPFSTVGQIQTAMTSGTTATAVSSTYAWNFSAVSSTSVNSGSFGAIIPTSTIEVFSQTTYEQWVPSWIRTLWYGAWRLAIWYGVGMATYALAMRILKKKEE